MIISGDAITRDKYQAEQMQNQHAWSNDDPELKNHIRCHRSDLCAFGKSDEIKSNSSEQSAKSRRGFAGKRERREKYPFLSFARMQFVFINNVCKHRGKSNLRDDNNGDNDQDVEE